MICKANCAAHVRQLTPLTVERQRTEMVVAPGELGETGAAPRSLGLDKVQYAA